MPNRRSRLIAALLLSLMLHATLLFLSRSIATDRPPPQHRLLSVTLAPRQAAIAFAAPTRPDSAALPLTKQGRTFGPSAKVHEIPASVPVPTPATPRIDLETAYATARAYGRKTPPRPPLETAKPPLTVESAVAAATRRAQLVETHGANGEYVTIDGNTRCVLPLQVPHFVVGTPIVAKCEARKS
jgi:hypothetical protein